MLAALLVALTVGCVPPPDDDTPAPDDDSSDDDSAADDDSSAGDDDSTGTDADGDGVTAEDGDCEDGDALVFPGRWDPPADGIDQDCNGTDSTGLAFSHAILLGEGAFEHNGRSVASIGDVDGDGLGDFVSGAPNHGGFQGAGVVWLWRGATLAAGGHLGAADADVMIEGSALESMTGHWVAGAGDVDGDGLGDVLIGAPLRDGAGGETNSGEAYLVLGSSLPESGTFQLADAHATFTGEAPFDEAGDLVASAGDVDGDGLDDVLVGAHHNDAAGDGAGRTYLFFASSIAAGGTIPVVGADAVFDGEAAGDGSGHSACGLGDIDDDGKGEIAIAASGNDEGGAEAGKVYLLRGDAIDAGGDFSLASAGRVLIGEQPFDKSGWAIAPADIDGDGLKDLLVSAHLSSETGPGAGKVHVVLATQIGGDGELPLSFAYASFVGEGGSETYDQAGQAVASAGDVDGDGREDVLVGAFFNDDGGFNAGKTYLLLGSRLALGGKSTVAEAAAAFVGEDLFLQDPTLMHDQSGEAVSSAGDVDGDGYDDFLIAAPDAFDGKGKTYVVLSHFGPTHGP